MGCERHFFDPAVPILDHAAHFLEQNWDRGHLDLRTTLIVVPTRHAGRRLRERLALDAAGRATAVLTGPVITPARLFAPAPDPDHPVAEQFVAQALWVETLRSSDPSLLAALTRATGGGSAYKAVAQHLVSLREQLAEEGYTISSFAARVCEEKLSEQPDRWAALARLEQAYLRTLKRIGYRDDVTEKLRAAAGPTIPHDIARIVVLFVPDPPPLSLRALEKLAANLPVHICIHAKQRDADSFDAWGRPAPAWTSRTLPVAAHQIEVCDDPIAMAERVREHIASFPMATRNGTAIGSADALHAEVIETTLARDNMPVFNPAARSALRSPLYTMIRDLLELRRTRSFRALADLVRHPYARARLESVVGAPDFLTALDDFQNEHLPATIETAAAIASARLESAGHGAPDPAAVVLKVIQEVKTWLAPFGETARLSVALPLALQSLLRGVPVSQGLKEARDRWLEALDALRTIESWCANLDEQCSWLLDIMSAQSWRRDRPADAVELLGWLELAWEDAPVVLLTDMNDGLVPETIPANPFLPDNLRRAAALRGNDQRLARDAFVLESVVRCRHPENVRFYVPRRSSDGHPLKPSRLLLQCPPDELAQRALQLFSDPPAPAVVVKRSPGWTFNPPLPSSPFTPPPLSITSLRDYLADPFLFYLKYILKMSEPFEPAFELDGAAFGSVCHAILQAFGSGPLRDSDNAEEIRAFLINEINRFFSLQFGNEPPSILLIQKDLIIQRMEAFAKEQAQQRKDGWVIKQHEHQVKMTIRGVELYGRIDRVDWHPDRRCYRIIDYKTTKAATNPADAHWKTIKGSNTLPRWAKTSDGRHAWTDLQLPLYAAAWVRSQYLPEKSDIEVAYFALPDDTTETAVLTWIDEDTWESSDIRNEARGCAERILSRIQAGVFWPPVPKPDEPFDRLFGDNVLASLNAEFRREMERRAEAYDRHADISEGGP